MILYTIMDIICLQNIGGRAHVLFIQIAKCADRRARTMGHAGSEYVFCLKCSHCCVYFIISYQGMKSWDLHVCDRASMITHVDRVKKSNP